MTQNDMKCHFESYFGVEIFGGGGVNFTAPPYKILTCIKAIDSVAE